MRIARVLTRLNLGGPARQVLASDPRLARRGHEIRIFVGSPEPGEGDLFDEARSRGLDVVRVPGLSRPWNVPGDLGARRFLRSALSEFQPDVVHSHASKAGALGRSAARAVPSAVRVHTFHGHVLEGYFPTALSRGLVALERRLARTTDRVVAVSHATADDLVRLGVAPEHKIVVVPPGIELEPFLSIDREETEGGAGADLASRLGAQPGARLVGAIGRLAAVKRPEWAVDVFELLAPRHPELELVFVGDGEGRRALEERIAGLGPNGRSRIHLLGTVADTAPILAGLVAVLSTSRSEGLPVALIEAGAAGLPVVATRAGGTAELVAEERTGFLGDTPAELAFGLSRILDDPGLGPALGRRARIRVAARHSAEGLADRLEALYQAVLEERRCAS